MSNDEITRVNRWLNGLICSPRFEASSIEAEESSREGRYTPIAN
jgi:hypothetical protein